MGTDAEGLTEAATQQGSKQDGKQAEPLLKSGVSAREAGRKGAAVRASRRKPKDADRDPTDAEIELGLRRKALTDPRAAEILLRWQAAHAGAPDQGEELDLDAMPIEQRVRMREQALRVCAVLAGPAPERDELVEAIEALLVSRSPDPPVPPRASESRGGEVPGEPHEATPTSAPPAYVDPPPPREQPHEE